MTAAHWFDFLLWVTATLNFLILGTSRIPACINALAAQGLVLSLLPVMLHGNAVTPHLMLISVGMLELKGLLMPWWLKRVTRQVHIGAEVEPLISFGVSLSLGTMGLAGAFLISAKLPLPLTASSSLIVPVALATVMTGLLILVSRTKAINQVLGYLVLENGVFLFGLPLSRVMPALIEVGILLDVFVGVFVMGIVIYHMNREFEPADARHSAPLRD